MQQSQIAAAAQPLRQILTACLQHIQLMEDSRLNGHVDLYHSQFQELKQFSESLKGRKEYACTEGEKEINRKKNRYKDILPFDGSRVALRELSGVSGSDYVNANYVRGASGSRAYIASQAPLPHTVNDFWRMIVECQVQVIVMACNADDDRKAKLSCERYWVDNVGDQRTFGAVTVRLVRASSVCDDFLVRTMRLSYTSVQSGEEEERTVCQFQYSAWPDHGVPGLVRPLVEMVRLMRETQASETLPVLVHCSAGCGRTGTICAIDFVWGLLRLGKLTMQFSVLAMVKEMRRQRVAMVQTKEQYVLVHQAVRELLRDQLQLIESHPYVNVDHLGAALIDEKEDITEKHVTTPRKKSFTVPHSKQEKEAENFTEKHRLSLNEKEVVANSSPSGSLSRRPKMARLRSIFERNSSAKQHQPVARSHSIGPVHLDRTKNLPIKNSGKLIVPKLVPPSGVVSNSVRPVPQIKRSKSLKLVVKEKPPLLSLIEFSLPSSVEQQRSHRPVHLSRENIYDNKLTVLDNVIKKRRSLESLIGDEPQGITWPALIKSPHIEKSTIKQHLQDFSQRKINMLATGLGIRERRNSFRQAVNKSDPILKSVRKTDSETLNSIEEHATIHIDGLSKRLEDGLTVKTLNGQTLQNVYNYENLKSSNSRQSHPNDTHLKPANPNRFLQRLNQEIHRKFNTPRRQANSSYATEDSATPSDSRVLYAAVDSINMRNSSATVTGRMHGRESIYGRTNPTTRPVYGKTTNDPIVATPKTNDSTSLQKFLDNAGVKFSEKPIKFESVHQARDVVKVRRGKYDDDLMRQEGGSESSGSSGARELNAYIGQVKEPRKVGVHSADSSPSIITMSTSRSASTSAAILVQNARRTQPLQQPEPQSAWHQHALGVDLDAIAANISLQRDTRGKLIDNLSVGHVASGSAPPTPMKKQQYL